MLPPVLRVYPWVKPWVLQVWKSKSAASSEWGELGVPEALG